MGHFVDYYCGDNYKELKKLLIPVVQRIGNVCQKDFDDFYSMAGLTVWECEKSYDKEKGVSFEGYLKACLRKRVISEWKKSCARKRSPDREAISIHTPLGEDAVVGDFLISDFTVEGAMELQGTMMDERVEAYLGSLSRIQRRIVEMKMDETPVREIKARLGLTDKEYRMQMQEIRSYERISILKRGGQDNAARNKREEDKMPGTVRDKTKRDFHSVLYYINQFRKGNIRLDHPQQRQSGQWSDEYRDGLIGSVLKNEDIPYIVICEQVRSDGVDNWLIEGLQRMSSLDRYRSGEFRLGGRLECPEIEYLVNVKDENGHFLCREDGSYMQEVKVFDIRHKGYADLPEELKEAFDEYQIMEVKQMDCSDAEIGYHIRRYNHAKRMNVAQNGITYLDRPVANRIKELTVTHPFFRDLGHFKPAERKNDTLNRIVIESIMAGYFSGEWKKSQKDMCIFLNKRLTADMTEQFVRELDRVSKLMKGDIASMFDAKDSFLWLALFHRFTAIGQEDCRYAAFLKAFQKELHGVEMEGVSWDSLNEKGTKDKNTVVKKQKLLEGLLMEFLSRGR